MIALAFTVALAAAAPAAGGVQLAPPGREEIAVLRDPRKEAEQIGRASCRERV